MKIKRKKFSTNNRKLIKTICKRLKEWQPYYCNLTPNSHVSRGREENKRISRENVSFVPRIQIYEPN